MQKRIASKTRGEYIVEQVVWNAAAGAVLAVMILVLLCALQWLDQVAPRPGVDAAPRAEPTRLARPVGEAAGRPGEVVAVNRPSG